MLTKMEPNIKSLLCETQTFIYLLGRLTPIYLRPSWVRIDLRVSCKWMGMGCAYRSACYQCMTEQRIAKHTPSGRNIALTVYSRYHYWYAVRCVLLEKYCFPVILMHNYHQYFENDLFPLKRHIASWNRLMALQFF